MHSMIMPSDAECLKQIKCFMQCCTAFVSVVFLSQYCFMLKYLANRCIRLPMNIRIISVEIAFCINVATLVFLQMYFILSKI